MRHWRGAKAAKRQAQGGVLGRHTSTQRVLATHLCHTALWGGSSRVGPCLHIHTSVPRYRTIIKKLSANTNVHFHPTAQDNMHINQMASKPPPFRGPQRAVANLRLSVGGSCAPDRQMVALCAQCAEGAAHEGHNGAPQMAHLHKMHHGQDHVRRQKPWGRAAQVTVALQPDCAIHATAGGRDMRLYHPLFNCIHVHCTPPRANGITWRSPPKLKYSWIRPSPKRPLPIGSHRKHGPDT